MKPALLAPGQDLRLPRGKEECVREQSHQLIHEEMARPYFVRKKKEKRELSAILISAPGPSSLKASP